MPIYKHIVETGKNLPIYHKRALTAVEAWEIAKKIYHKSTTDRTIYHTFGDFRRFCANFGSGREFWHGT